MRSELSIGLNVYPAPDSTSSFRRHQRLNTLSLSFYNNTMAPYTEILTLNTGAKFPAVGLGTWQAGEGTDEVVSFALKHGYRAIDGAFMYQNEESVGKGIKDSGIDRKDIFVTTKLAPAYMRKDKIKEGIDKSLKALDLDYIDLYLVHWPCEHKPSRLKILLIFRSSESRRWYIDASFA